MEITIKQMFDLCLIIALFLLFVKPVIKILNIYPAAPDIRAPTHRKQAINLFLDTARSATELGGHRSYSEEPHRLRRSWARFGGPKTPPSSACGGG